MNFNHWRIRGSARDTPSGSKFFYFLCSFRQKKCEIIGEHTHLGSATASIIHVGNFSVAWNIRNHGASKLGDLGIESRRPDPKEKIFEYQIFEYGHNSNENKICVVAFQHQI